MSKFDALRNIGTETTRNSLILGYLLVLYILFGWLVIGTLSAQGFQEKIKRADNERFTVQSVFRIHAQANDAEMSLYFARDDFSKIEEGYQEAQAVVETNEIEANNILNDQDIERLRLGRYLLENYPDHPAFGQPTLDLDGLGIIDLNIMSISREIMRTSDDEKLKELMASVRQINDKFLRFNNTRDADMRKRNLLSWQKDDLESDIVKKENELEDLLKDGAADFLSELDFFRQVGFSALSVMPTQLLTLVLTLAMGALGSLLYMTTDYFRRDVERKFSWYFFRPFLGMVTAVAIFILFKAGQLTISNAGGSNGVMEDLNPFFIAFLGIISGLLSEQAVDRIRRAGLSVFRTQAEDRERWASGLQAALDGRGPDDFKPHVSAPRETVEEWFTGKRPVPPNIQQVISAWLGKPVRDLFSDLEPAR